MSKKYWQSIEELNGEPLVKNEIDGSSKPEDNSYEHPFSELASEKIEGFVASRRSFLKMFGYSISAAAIAASCRGPVREAIPYVVKPEEITPGMAIHYASTFYNGFDYCSILVKTRDGRPIKIEGNEMSKISHGGTNARTQASILGLYDENRIKWPLSKNQMTTWDKVDKEVVATLKAISGKEGKIVLIAPSIISPSTSEAINEFVDKYPSVQVLKYDAVSYSGMLIANENCFKQRLIPGYSFDKANVIVSFGADFLGNWISPVEFTNQYVKTRRVNKGKKTMSFHAQFETNLSLTGSNADKRYPILPSEEGLLLSNLYNELVKLDGTSSYSLPKSNVSLRSLAKRLWQNKGKSIVVSGTNDIIIQTIVNSINVLLESYGNTIDFNIPLNLKQGIDQEMVDFVEEMEQRKVDAVILYDVNPAYDYPEAEKVH